MKRKLTIFALLLLANIATAFAYSYSEVSPSGHTLYYNFSSSSDGIYATVTYQNYHDDAVANYSNLSGDLIIPDSVGTDGNKHPVKAINQYAFYYCMNLKSVVLPSTLTSIGMGAFYHSGLEGTITIPSSVSTISYDVFAYTAIDTIIFYSKPITLPSFNFSLSPNLRFLVSCDVYDDFYSAYGTHVVNMLPEGVELTLTSADTNKGTVSGRLYCDSNAVITATAKYGYEFDHWSTGSTNAQDTVKLTASTTITAYFKPHKYSVYGLAKHFKSSDWILISNWYTPNDTSIYYSDHYNTNNALYNIESNGSGYAYTIVDLDSGEVYYLCYTTSWRISPANPSNTYSIHISDTSLIYLSMIGGQIIFKPTSSSAFDYSLDGDNYTIRFTANHSGPHKLWIQWTSIASTAYYSNYHTAPTLYNIRLFGPNIGGADYAVLTGAEPTDYQDTAVLTASSSDPHYYFSRWSDGNTDNPRSIIVTQDTLIEPVYAAEQVNVTLLLDSVSGYNNYGTAYATARATLVGAGSYDYLSTRTIRTNTGYSGYAFSHWNDGNTDNPRTILLTQDTTFTAYLVPDTFTVNVSVNNMIGGMIMCLNNGSSGYNHIFNVPFNDTLRLEAIPSTGYRFVHWEYYNTAGSITYAYDNTFNHIVRGNNIIMAVFEEITYNLNVMSTPYSGGHTNGGGNYAPGVYTISATANYGYHFKWWNDSVTTNPRTVNLTQDTSFVAVFEGNPFELTLEIAGGHDDWGTLEGAGTHPYGSSVLISATPAEHHHFVKWWAPTYESYNATDYVTINGDMTIYAYFAVDTYHVAVTSSNVMMGGVEGGGTFQYGEPCTVEATAYSGYRFLRWSNGVTYNPYTFVPTSDMDLVAIFADEGAVVNLTVNVNDPSMGSVTGGGPYAKDMMATIEAIPNPGYKFLRWDDGSTTNPRDILMTEDKSITAYFALNTNAIDAGNDNVVAKATVENGHIIISGAQGRTVQLFGIDGRLLAQTTNSSDPTVLDVPVSGVYIVRIDGQAPIRLTVVK